MEDHVHVRVSCNRVRQTKHIAVAPTITLLVLHDLIRQRPALLCGVPVGDSTSQRSAPTTHLIDVGNKVEQVRSGSDNLVQMIERILTYRRISVRCRHCQSEQGWIVLWCAVALANVDNKLNCLNAIAIKCSLRILRILQRQVLRLHVVGTSIRSKDQEAL